MNLDNSNYPFAPRHSPKKEGEKSQVWFWGGLPLRYTEWSHSNRSQIAADAGFPISSPVICVTFFPSLFSDFREHDSLHNHHPARLLLGRIQAPRTRFPGLHPVSISKKILFLQRRDIFLRPVQFRMTFQIQFPKKGLTAEKSFL